MPVIPNSKHERFAQEVAQGKSASEAYVLAGYSKNDSNAARLNGNERVRSRIEEILSEGAARAGVTVEWITERLRENVERAMQLTAVRDNEGELTGEYKYEGNVANRALELLGKQVGMFKDRVEHSGNGVAFTFKLDRPFKDD